MNNITIKKILTLSILAMLALFVLSCGAVDSTGETPVAEVLDLNQTTDSPRPVYSPSPSPSPSRSPLPSPSTKPNPAPATPQEEEPSPEPEPEKAPIEAWPVWMYIPSIGVDAEVQDTGTDYVADSMEIVPSGRIISWWRESAIPGNDGNAIFGGHNKWSGAYGQLYSMDTMNIGDEMEIVYDDGTSLIFRLESVFVYPLATAPADIIMDTGGEARVTVITCKEPFNPNTGTSDNRIIATFKEESVFVIPDPPIERLPLRDEYNWEGITGDEIIDWSNQQ